MNLAKNDVMTLANTRYRATLCLDYTHKRVYWVSDIGIFSTGYSGENTTTVKSGSFNYLLLGLVQDSVYFQKRNVRYINERNITSGVISRSIKVEETEYRDLVIVHNSLQPIGELQKSTIILRSHVTSHI